MKFFAIFSLTAVAVAAPADVQARTGGGNPPQGGPCSLNGNNIGKVTCCNSAIPILGDLLCDVLTVGKSCTVSQTAYCCNTSNTVSTFSPY